MAGGSPRPEFDGWLAGSAPFPVRPGNTVRPLIDGEPAFRRICEAIEGARLSVWATVTFLWDGFEMPHGHGLRGEPAEASLPAAVAEPRPRGASVVQVQRAMPNGHDRESPAGPAGPPAYVHGKLMLIGDEWATVGSCNLHAASLFLNAELNASWRDPVIAARESRLRWDAGQPWTGLAFSLDPAVYARRRFPG